MSENTPLPFVIPIHNQNFVTFIHGFLYDDYYLDDEVVEWLGTIEGKWAYDGFGGYEIKFEYESDALLFKLTWC